MHRRGLRAELRDGVEGDAEGGAEAGAEDGAEGGPQRASSSSRLASNCSGVITPSSRSPLSCLSSRCSADSAAEGGAAVGKKSRHSPWTLSPSPPPPPHFACRPLSLNERDRT